MRVVVEYRTASRECYNDFCRLNPTIKLSFEKWREIIYTHNQMYVDHVLETGQAVKFPYGFGRFSINKKKPKATRKWKDKVYINLPIDWKKTKEHGKKMYHMNAHTNGYKCSWMWFQRDARFADSDIWNFKPCRVISRLVAKYLKRSDKNYVDVYVEWTA